jgi:hypothetical protein
MRAVVFRRICILFTCLVINFAAIAQADDYRIYVDQTGWSIGMNFGYTDMWGNVGTASPIDHYLNSNAFTKPCFMGGILGRFTLHPWINFRMQLNFGALFATDAWNYDLATAATTSGSDAFQRYARNQQAKDYLVEGLAMVEYSLFRRHPESALAHRKGTPYVGFGVGGFYFVPYNTLAKSSTWVPTYDLHLEGEGWGAGFPKEYSLFQPCVPVDIGYRWDISKHCTFGVEFMYRFTFFGYLDGVSNKYIDSASITSHLNAHDAALALQMYDKSYLKNLEARAEGGAARGVASTQDAYSTITFTFYYKVIPKIREWWRHWD